MNALDPDTMALLGKAIDTVGKKFKALVIYNEGSNFSVGANLGLALFAANIAAWTEIEQLVGAGPEDLRAAEIRALPRGRRARPAWRSAAAARSCCIATPSRPMPRPISAWSKCGVGLVPGWGGCKEMLHALDRHRAAAQGPDAGGRQGVRDDQHRARSSKSAAEAKELLFLRPTDGVTMNRYRLLADAKAQGADARRGLQAAGAAELLTCRARPRAVALEMAVDGFAAAGQGDPARRGRRPARWPKCCRAARRT